MAQVVRYFHVRPTSRWYEQDGFATLPRGGATVRVVGEDDGKAVRVQVAYCSPKDQFCRKTGRERAGASPTAIAIPLKGLPGLLTKVSRKVMRKQHLPGEVMGYIPHAPKKSWRRYSELWDRDWSFSMKYWTSRPTTDLGTLLKEQVEAEAHP